LDITFMVVLHGVGDSGMLGRNVVKGMTCLRAGEANYSLSVWTTQELAWCCEHLASNCPATRLFNGPFSPGEPRV
jgi:hypothetical protein